MILLVHTLNHAHILELIQLFFLIFHEIFIEVIVQNEFAKHTLSLFFGQASELIRFIANIIFDEWVDLADVEAINSNLLRGFFDDDLIDVSGSLLTAFTQHSMKLVGQKNVRLVFLV